MLLKDWNNVSLFSRFPPLQRVTSGLSVPVSSRPGNSRLQPHYKDMFSAASRAGWAPDRADPWLCGPQEPPQSLNSQPERPELHHPSLAASIALRQVTCRGSHTRCIHSFVRSNIGISLQKLLCLSVWKWGKMSHFIMNDQDKLACILWMCRCFSALFLSAVAGRSTID